MVKSVYFFSIALILILVGGFFEYRFIHSKFDEFGNRLESAVEKIDENNDDHSGIDSMIEWWHQEKRKVNIFVPHNEVKEIEGMLVEAKYFIITGNYEFAKVRLKKLENYVIAIPHNFVPLMDNIF